MMHQASPFVITERDDEGLIDDFDDYRRFNFPPMTKSHSNYNRLVYGVYGDKKMA